VKDGSILTGVALCNFFQGSFESACMEMGIHSGDEIDIVWERRPPPSLSRLGWLRMFGDDSDKDGEHKLKDPRAARVASIGREIIRAARKYVTVELEKAVLTKRQQLLEKSKEENKALTQHELLKAVNEDDQIQKWTHAYERIEGYTHDGIQNWQCKYTGSCVFVCA
jgi:hypothetical protein